MATPRRTNRLASILRAELAEMFLREVSDPALARISVTEVRVSSDMRDAKVYYEAGDSPEREVEAGLKRAAPLLRNRLAARIEVRSMPELRFIRDKHTASVANVYRLFDEIKAQQQPPAVDGV